MATSRPNPRSPAQPAAPRGSRAASLGGAACLAVAAGASLLLALDHLGAINAPGCGGKSPCETLAAGKWGSIPGLEWPVSFVGAAWFAAMLAAWLSARGQRPRGLMSLIRIGGMVSVVLTAVMLVERLLCPYCLAVHVANFAFWVIAERASLAGGSAGLGRGRTAVAAAVLVFSAVSLAMGIAHAAVGERVRARAERDLASSTAAIRQASPEGGFAGRYREGPAQARVRVVMFTDYQCEDCSMVERQIEAARRTWPDLAVSIKHFPMCTDCNPHASNLHPNACWAARAAEAGGILQGAEGFWKVHRWLFARGGGFTNEELDAGLATLGLEPAAFLRIMQGPETLARVEADIAEAMSLGLFQTPTIFINGVELKGWNAPDAVTRALAAAFDTPFDTVAPAADTPPGALEKVIDDWFNQPSAMLPIDNFPRVRGLPGAPVRIVMWGDYQEPGTAEADRTIRALMSTTDLTYDFRPFPFNLDCNPAVTRTAHPLACLAAQAAEAAAVLGGEEGFAAMHDWLMDHVGDLTHEALMVVAPALGFDREALWEAMQTPELMGSILEDAAAGHEAGVTALPAIFLNGRPVPRWKVGDENFLPFLIDAAVGVP